MHDTIVRLADVWRTCNKIRAAVFRCGLNLWEWFLPLDPDGNALISECKFVSILAGPLRTPIGLTAQEITQLADYFRTQDGRVLYRQLCRLVHGEDEPRPPVTALEARGECPPPAGPPRPPLDEWQALRLCTLLATIADRQLPLRPYFQDYELVSKSDGRVTFAHFSRIMRSVGLLLSAADFSLLVRRFVKDSYTIDYVEFLQAIDLARKGGLRGLGPAAKNPATILDTTPPKSVRPEMARGPPVPPARNVEEIMMRVQEFVKERRIRVSEFLRDYDPLNSGRISPAQFRRALDTMGLTSVLRGGAGGGELACIMRQYLDPNEGDKICWRTFEDDCDRVFTVKELEKHPDLNATPIVNALPKPGATAPSTELELDACEAAMQRVRRACCERSLNLRRPFRDHDRHNSGHVPISTVARALARLPLLLAPAQLAALQLRYVDDCGFHYTRMLEELEELPAPSVTAQAPTSQTTEKAAPDPHETDIVQILAKIKGKIVREGIRPLQFLEQHDPHHELVISRNDFYRSLATSSLSLSPVEMDTLMEVFAAPGRRRYIEYYRFCETIGEALTQGGLERAPLLTPIPHVAPPRENFLNFEERHIVSQALAKLAEFPDRVSNILEIFKDMDPSRCGSVSRGQVERALCRRGLLERLSARERDLVYKCFGCGKECHEEVNYRGLVNALDLISAAGNVC